MDVFLIKAFQLILALAILVIIHEFGHFVFARIFGVKVEKFYIFFDPWFELFKWKPKKYIGGLGRHKKISGAAEDEGDADSTDKDSSDAGEEVAGEKGAAGGKKRFWSETEYGIGWLPFGGYCKIAGMVDESMDLEQMKKPAQPWEFRSKPAWQRLLIMIAGVLFNFLLAILIYAGIVYATGEKYVDYKDARMGFYYSGEARKAGFHNGDIPLTADGEPVGKPDDNLRIMQASEVSVLRGKDTVNISLPSDFMLRLNNELESDTATVAFMAYRIPTVVKQVVAGGGADKVGIRPGDVITAINDKETPAILDFFEEIQHHPNETVKLRVEREGKPMTMDVNLSESAKLGVNLEVDPTEIFESQEKRYSLLASVPRGIEMGTDKLTSYAKSMKMVFTREGAKSIGGFGAIGSIFPEKWDWIAFWNIAAFLSVALAFMNILPIPALDGGHVLFLLYEVVTGRKPNDKFLEYAQMTGMVLLILLLLYANGMDIIRFFTNL